LAVDATRTMLTSTTLRPRVSRETRQLLLAALIALLALWVLARIRFPGQPPSPNPIPSLLPQLSVAPRFANLAGEIAELQRRFGTAWLAIPVSATDSTIENGARHLTAMRLSNDTAVMLLRSGDRMQNDHDLFATDRVTGLAIVRADETPSRAEIARWMPPGLDGPRYLMATIGTPAGVSLRPVLVGALHEIESPAWPGPIWSVPEGTDLAASAFVFTTSGEIAGLVAREPPGLAIIPWDIVLAEATRILERGRAPALDLGVEVRPLTPALTQATGAARGVVVAWVDPRGPMARQIAVGDVVQSINAQAITHVRDWEVTTGRLTAGNATFGVRRRGKSMEIGVTLAAAGTSTVTVSLGLRMRDVPGVGTTILRIDPRSAANAARLQEGDIITLAGDITAPTAAQIGDAFRSARTGEAIMLAITRGRTHLVVGLVK
jgi:PDZ domain-containing protein